MDVPAAADVSIAADTFTSLTATLKPLTLQEALLISHARLGHPEEVAALLSSVDVNCRGVFGTPLIEACRSDNCSPLVIETVRELLSGGASIEAADTWGATTLILAAIRCSVLPEQLLWRAFPAPGLTSGKARRHTRASVLSGATSAGSSALASASSFFSKLATLLDVPPSSSPTSSEAADKQQQSTSLRRRSTMNFEGGLLNDEGEEEEEEGRRLMALLRSSEGYDPVEDERRILLEKFAKAAVRASADAAAASADKSAKKPTVAPVKEGDEEGKQAEKPEGESESDEDEEDAGTALVRPRFSSDGSATRHIQLVTLLLNHPQCPVLARTINGVNAAMVMAACPSPDALPVLQWILEKAASASREGGVSIWEPDAAGATLVHYAAYAASADCLRLLSRLPDTVCPEGLLPKMIATKDRFGRTPLDVLNIYSEETIQASTRTQALKKIGLWSEVPFENRKKEFRALATSLL